MKIKDLKSNSSTPFYKFLNFNSKMQAKYNQCLIFQKLNHYKEQKNYHKPTNYAVVRNLYCSESKMFVR